MSVLKTQPNDHDVEAFLHAISDEQKRKDSFNILIIMKEITGEEPVMWGNSIIGFGSYHYKYKSGREGEWFLTGFSPRKQQFSLYIMSGFDRYDKLLNSLGEHKTGKSCLYIRRLADINITVLRTLIEESVTYMQEKYKNG